MQAYLDDPKLKHDFLEQLRWHADNDAILQGTYGETEGGKWRGCAVGCSIHSLAKLRGETLRTADHSLYESLLGIPEWLARLEDALFEGMPKREAMSWPVRFAEAIHVGADLGPVKWRFCAYLMRGNIERVLALDLPDALKDEVVGAIRGVLAVHEAAAASGVWDESAAESAAEYAAESAAESGAWSARSAWSAAESAGCPRLRRHLSRDVGVAP